METVDIKIDEIQDPAFQPRQGLAVDGIEALATSIDEIGLINPIVVRKAGDGYELVAGTRRWHAHKLLGRETILARVIEQDSRETAMLQFSENFHRQDLNPIEQAQMLKFMLEELQYSTAELAKFCNRSREWVSRTLTLLDLSTHAQEAIQGGQLSASVAQELKLIPDDKLRADYIDYAIKGGCTEKAARDWARQAKATIAARDLRVAQKESQGEQPSGEEYQPPKPHTCALCNAPADKVLLEDWQICWHCGQKLKGEVK